MVHQEKDLIVFEGRRSSKGVFLSFEVVKHKEVGCIGTDVLNLTLLGA